MCGIVGIWSRAVRDGAGPVREMMAALRHRGPDSDGMWTSPDGEVVFGHLRLAIVDLTIEGAQPMKSRSGRYWIVYNGEIYNHMELREQLGDVPWRGHSDTETLLEAVERWGLEGALKACVGMFAIALWDAQARTLSLARDRMGEKPLYLGRGNGTLAFASELRAMRHVPGLDLSLDLDALREFARTGYIAAPASAYRSVRKVSPGTILTLRGVDDAGVESAYWTMPAPSGHVEAQAMRMSDDEWLDELSSRLERSVAGQLLSDVPLGAFLSGGIDSSLVVAMMQRASSTPVRTFAMGMDAIGDDESVHAARVARHLGTEHTTLMVQPEDVIGVVADIGRIYDEPFADSSQVPTVLLSRLTRRSVTVALSGDAGDELFGGYNRHLIAARLEPMLKSAPLWLRRSAAACLDAIPARVWDGAASSSLVRRAVAVPQNLSEKMSRIAGFVSAPDPKQAYRRAVSQWLDDGSIPVRETPREVRLAACDDAAIPQQMMFWDMQTYLPDDILVKVDRAAMSCSLETRVPFLDHRVVELALRMPMHQKIRQGKTKWILRELLHRHVPRELTERPKHGFSLPIAQWLRGPLRDWAESLLQPRSLERSGIWVPQRIDALWREHLSGRFNHQRALWTVLMLQSWLQGEAARS
ncbi:MAG: asparagine synthase (glutamine-hydrolyzing) [Burkholderiaceae bacterium]